MYPSNDWDERTLNYLKVTCYAVTLAALAAGIYFRFKGLDKSPFTVDEYYIASSIKNILKYGLPQFDCGGYYTRGLLLQYIAVPFFIYGSNDELYLRLVTVLFNLLTIPALYLLTRDIAGRLPAYAVVILFSLSIWETEFARFARMYAPFQAVFAWYVYFLYRVLVRNEASKKKLVYLLSILGVFIYEGAIFLVLLNFLPLVLGKENRRISDYALASIIFVFAVLYIRYDFRFMGAGSPLPAGVGEQVAEGTAGPIELPIVLLTTLGEGSYWTFALIGLNMWGLLLTGRMLKACLTKERREGSIRFAILCIGIIVLSMLNLYALIIFLTALAVLLNWVTGREVFSRTFLEVLAFAGVMLCFWVTYLAFAQNGVPLDDDGLLSQIKDLAVVLLGYPDVYRKILYFWLGAMPVQTALIAILIMLGMLDSLARPYKERQAFLLLIAITVGLSIAMAILKQPYGSIRYTFFLYPIVLVAAVISAKILLQKIVRNSLAYGICFAASMAMFIAISEDFRIGHLVNIDSDRVLYRIGFDGFKRDQYYNRLDFRAPAEFVNKNMKPGEIVVSTDEVVPYYLDRIDYTYVDQQYRRFAGIVGCGGERELWSNARLIYRQDKLMDLVNGSGTDVWVIVRNDGGKAERRISKALDAWRVFRSVDGGIDVYRVSPRERHVSGVAGNRRASATAGELARAGQQGFGLRCARS